MPVRLVEPFGWAHSFALERQPELTALLEQGAGESALAHARAAGEGVAVDEDGNVFAAAMFEHKLLQ